MAIQYLSKSKLKNLKLIHKRGAGQRPWLKKTKMLAGNLYEIDFDTADKIALSIGMEHDCPQRIIAGILHVLPKCAYCGGAFLIEYEVEREVGYILDLDLSGKLADLLFYMGKENLIMIRDITMENGDNKTFYYSNSIYFDELYVYHRIANIGSPPEIDKALLDEWIDSYSQTQDINVSKEQAGLIRNIVCEKFSILTDGVEYDRIDIVYKIIELIGFMDLKSLVVSLTSDGTQDMDEVVGEEKSTSFYTLSNKYSLHMKKDNDQLEIDFLIINEAGMLDICELAALLKVIPETTQILLIGDLNHSHPDGNDTILKNIIDQKTAPHLEWKKNSIQDKDSSTIKHAVMANKGKIPAIISPFIHPEILKENMNFLFSSSDGFMTKQISLTKKEKGFCDIESSELKSNISELSFEHYAIDAIKNLCEKELPKLYKNQEIQLITPMVTGILGTNNLNKVMQELINPVNSENEQITIGNNTFRVGDRVVQMRNNDSLGVYAGAIGEIIDIDNAGLSCEIDYSNGSNIDYNQYNFMELDLAYAIPINKYKNKKFDIVIMPVLEQHNQMLSRDIIYTGITRAKKLVVFVGDRSAYKMAVCKQGKSKR